MTELDIGNMSIEARPIRASKATLELALQFLQFSTLTGEPVDEIWETIEFEMTTDLKGNRLVKPTRGAFEQLNKMLNDPEVSRKAEARLRQLMEGQDPDASSGSGGVATTGGSKGASGEG